ncbi:hypothetical protein T08_12764 [Trichinella sp. T8]|nr:hypothetical protein T08_12764 [Trichinella sp. T8]
MMRLSTEDRFRRCGMACKSACLGILSSVGFEAQNMNFLLQYFHLMDTCSRTRAIENNTFLNKIEYIETFTKQPTRSLLFGSQHSNW